MTVLAAGCTEKKTVIQQVPSTAPAPPPVVTAVVPSFGPTSGGTAVTITGSAFQNGATVTIGGTAATSVALVSPTQLAAVTPPGTAGARTVTVTNPDGQSGALGGGFTYGTPPSNPPTVTNVSPAFGPTAGGTAITVTGSAFVTGATVTIGGTAATSVAFVSATQLTAVTPAGSAGSRTVVVTNPDGQAGALGGGFTYGTPPSSPPAVTNVSPSFGPTAGGTAITVTGSAFATGATVTIGGTAATSVAFVSATQLTAVTPGGSAGTLTVTVTNPDGQSGALGSGFTYGSPPAAPPSVSNISPAFGPTSGGTAATITGSAFQSGATVTVGGTAATSVVFVSAAQLTAVTPAGSAGARTVVVTNPDGQSGAPGGGFTYGTPPSSPPTVTNVSPSFGPTSGGTTVTITGSAFQSGATVTIGGTAATSVLFVSATQLTAVTPGGSAGTLTVTVTNPDGQSGALGSGFTYGTPPSAPVVTNVSPAFGPTSGGTAITLTGTGFASGATVTIGGALATSVVFVSATQLTAVTPAGGAGAQTVVVTNPSGLAGSLGSGFTYGSPPAAPPSVSNVSPAFGPTSGGTAVTITGAAFQSGATVTIGGTAAASIGFVSATQLTAVTPAGTAGARTVTVTNPDGQSGALGSGFTYGPSPAAPPSVSNVSPAFGPTAGGTAITITGSAFQSGATVTVGGVAAASVVFVSATQLTAVTPAGSAGARTVVVTNPDGQAGALGGGFTYGTPPSSPPTVTNVSPAFGPTAGGTSITITGSAFGTGATVTIGATAATSVGFVSATQLTAVTPGGSAGTLTVTVTNPDGQSGALGSGFTYGTPPTGPPVVTNVSPAFGPTAGGTAITLTGSAFVTGATVSIGGAAATGVAFVSVTQLTAVTPVGSAGAQTVIVTNPDTQTGALGSGFTYGTPAGAPVVTNVSPAFGPPAGGTAITLTGTNFVSGATVTIGGNPATSVVFASATQLTAVTPAGSAGAQTVIVTNPSGLAGSLGNGFTYGSPPASPPTLTAVVPAAGPLGGGTAVTLTGSAFQSGAGVAFGGSAATSVVFVSATQLTAVTPAGSAGPVTVVVTNPDTQSGALGNGFTYVPPPAVTVVSPPAGLPGGGTAITINGSAFQPGATVTIGGAAVASVAFVSATQLTAVTPAGTLGAQTVVVTNPDTQSGALASGFTYDNPPAITTTLAPFRTVLIGDTVTFTVTATDPNGDAVALRLLNPPPACNFDPLTGTSSPGTVAARWKVTTEWGGLRWLIFQANDTLAPSLRTTLAVPVHVVGAASRSAIVVADVTGDGILDAVAGAVSADVGGTTNTGAVYLWAGRATPSGIPTATLRIAGAVAGDQLGNTSGQAIQCADVTGDGTLDVLVGTFLADVGGTADTGAVYVWAGGSGLSGTLSPTATLRVSGAVAGDQLGLASGQGIQCADVTGDGTLDVVVGAAYADVGGTVDAGAVYVWAGGSGLTGTPAPTAVLTVSGAVTNDRLGTGTGQAILCADVTGDGTADVVVGAFQADVGGTVNTGAVHVWAGGSGLAGTLSPTATLRVSGAVTNDGLGDAQFGQAIQCADVTGDGTLDVVVGAYQADIGGTTDTGAVYVWAGGSGLAGTLSPTATLRVSGAVAGDSLGSASGQAIQCADVSGDGTLDIVVGANAADVGGTVDTGAVYVWAGGSGLAGTLSPTATLRVAGAVASDRLGFATGQAIQCADVSGDGILDVVVGASQADIGGTTDTGAVYMWAGGSGLTGTLSSTATLGVVGAVAGDQVGLAVGQAVQCADVTGDGVLDIVAGAQSADAGATANTGAVYVWAGGSGLTGTLGTTATLQVAGAVASDQLGAAVGQAIQCADVTGDGTPDIIAGAQVADVGGTTNTGAVYVWAGGSGLSGTLSPTATLRVAGAVANDQLGNTPSGQAIQCADVTGDGTLDLVVGAFAADVGGTADTGAVYVWAGGTGLTGTLSPTATLRVSGAVASDRLGDAAGQGIQCADVTGDGTIDLVVGARLADVGVTANAGAVYHWAGGSGLTGTVSPTTTLAVPSAVAGDQLGF
ncbi:MAG: IPT/TIG domain-containing protein [Planctomycetales bacterium]|nr:IPT/TIG domain-containing protein [Planctomycetales bacterium]